MTDETYHARVKLVAGLAQMMALDASDKDEMLRISVDLWNFTEQQLLQVYEYLALSRLPLRRMVRYLTKNGDR